MRVIMLSVLVLGLFPGFLMAQRGPTPVQVAPVEQGALELTRPLVATIQPITRTTIAAEYEGIVAKRSFDAGDTVERGAVLAAVKTDLLEAQTRAAEARMKSLAAQLEQSRAELSNAQRELARVSELVEQNVAPAKELSDAQTALDVAGSVAASREASILEQQAELARLALLMDKSQTRSPLSGVIARRHVEVGQWIRQGDPVADLVQLDALWVVVGVPEAAIGEVSVGDQVTVAVDAFGGEQVTGTIEQILPEADPASRTLPIRIRLDNADGRLRPGFFVRATLSRKTAADQYLIPRDALVRTQQDAHVVAVRDGVAAVVPVQVVGASGDRVAVKGELAPGDVVVIRGNENLQGGEPLMPMGPAQAGR
jgi:RND family efflux transporter MFP subunit